MNWKDDARGRGAPRRVGIDVGSDVCGNHEPSTNLSCKIEALDLIINSNFA